MQLFFFDTLGRFYRLRNRLRITTGAKKNPAGVWRPAGVKEVYRF